MSDQASAQVAAPTGIGGISPIWLLIGVIMIVALYTTIHGLYSLTGSYIYAIPFGLVAQSILLIVSLNLGRDLARAASGRSVNKEISGVARGLRMLFLVAIYLLFFGICWFFAFSTYYNIFLQRGDDVQTTASQAVQFSDVALKELRERGDKILADADTALRTGSLVKDFVKQARGVREAAARPEVSATIEQATYQAALNAFDARQSQRDQWRTERVALEQRQKELQGNIATREKELTGRKTELEKLPVRIRDLRRAFQEETTGVLPALEQDAAPPPSQPTVPAPQAQPGAPATPTQPAAPGAQTQPTPPAAPAAQKRRRPGPATPPPTTPAARPEPATPPPTTPAAGLKGKGLASTLLPNAAACSTDRSIGSGHCSAALEAGLKEAENRLPALPREIAGIESSLEALRAEESAIPGRLATIDQQLKDNPSLPRPTRSSTPGVRLAGPDLVPLIDAFDKNPTESTFIALGDACGPIETALRGLPKPPPEVSGFECRPVSVLTAIRKQRQLVEAHRAFADRCGERVADDRTNTIVANLREDFARNKVLYRENDEKRRDRLGQTFDQVRQDVVDPCYPLATAVGVKADDLSQAARAFEDKVSPRQTDFSLASNAVVQVLRAQATPPAYLGALFAAAQELAILLLSILRDINRTVTEPGEREPSDQLVNWGPDPRDPPLVAAAKTILRAPGTPGHGSLRLSPDFGEDEKSDVQANIQQLLRELRREKTAKRTFFGFGRYTRLTSAAIESLEARVKEYGGARRTGAVSPNRATAAPGPVAATVPARRDDEGARPVAEAVATSGEPRMADVSDAADPDQGAANKGKTGRRFGTRA